jgi:sialate O-acetylesterase
MDRTPTLQFSWALDSGTTVAHYQGTSPKTPNDPALENQPVNASPWQFVSAILILVCGGLGASASPASGEVTLPHLFGDNMVLQADRPLPVWGWAAKGEQVTVTLAGLTRTATTGADGRWKLVLPSLSKGGPLELTVKGSAGSVRVLKNVLLGEVWLTSGQSNMDMPIGNLIETRDKDRAEAHYPKLRVFTVKGGMSEKLQPDCEGAWTECSPETVWRFSAISYYFGRRIHQEFKTPVGMIVSTMGATWIERWSSRKSLENDPEVKEFHAGDSLLYNAMIAPLAPYAIRGMLWYQGETNVGSPHYQAFLSAMIRDRRSDWGQADLPFGIIQIAPYRYEGDPAACPELWEAELKTHKALPNTGLIVTSDVGDPKEIHPVRKLAVGQRAALWAMATVYGRKDLVYSGPIYRAMKREANRIRLEFDHVGGGLSSRDGRPLSHFTIAGEDHVFHLATAVIEGATLAVSSPLVAQPVAVRFAWRDDAEPNLCNREGLPAMPFRTDTWRRVGDPITMPHFFSDHMVLQRERPLPIWGWAGPGRWVKVTFDQQPYMAVADAQGRWSVTLPPQQAGGPHTINVADAITIGDIMIGDVWVCAGQSNIEKPIGPHPGQKPCLNWEKEIAAADYPQIRLLEVPPTPASEPAADVQGKWLPCSPQNIVIKRGGGCGYSACAYFFGRELHKELKVPIGLIAASVSGTRCEPWTPEQDPSCADKPVWYNGMIAPLVPLAIRGAIWYQGESNVGDGMGYAAKMKTLIAGWRQAWGQGDFPFYFVQLPNYRCGGDSLARLREAQTATLGVPNTGMAVTIDIGSYPDCHCPDKQDVGKRLALLALAKTYGRKDLVCSGPVYRSMQVEGDAIRLRFDNSGHGLATRDGAKDVTCFEIAGADQKFVAARARIEGDSVLVFSPAVHQPAAVRFAWDEQAVPNLMNKEGLPVSTFRTNPPPE